VTYRFTKWVRFDYIAIPVSISKSGADLAFEAILTQATQKISYYISMSYENWPRIESKIAACSAIDMDR
jgi:hypothetical protein